MCDTAAYLVAGGSEERLLESVDYIRVEEGGRLYLRNIFGEEKTITGRIREISLSKHRVVIEEG